VRAFTFFYWSFLAFVIGLLVYASVFSLVPLLVLLGGIVTTLGYAAFLAIRFKRSGTWEHGRFRLRFHAILVLYIAAFWIVVSLFTNVREQHEFWARPEREAASDGRVRGYVLHYVDFPGSYERVNSTTLNRHLDDTRPSRVRMTIETTRDLGRLRAYSVESVDGIRVNDAWSGGSPPWDEIRNRAATP